ncbi:MAG: methylmalonyl Co-A mutase-associated GTPase MeaB, partial [Chloroflexota bacterium]|nr:methylmalonyl Co-A mutase-associated GTPase MeaB [Chloroflexota bacterium]
MAKGVLNGEIGAVARSITAIENDLPFGQDVLARIFPHSGNAHLIGITGPPGAGKSTLVNELIRVYRAGGNKVAVLAIDPSSPLTGGATLGDRIRMLEWHNDPDVFVRSMASRRFGGGLAQHTLTVAHVFDAAGFDPVIIETVGTGQDEVGIASLAHSTVLVQAPGMGDSVQTLKAGALEIGDIIVVSKGDRTDSQALARDLRRLQTLHDREDVANDRWIPPIVMTSAIEETGFAKLAGAIGTHKEWLRRSGTWEERVRTMLATEITSRVQRDLMRRIQSQGASQDAVIEAVLNRQISPLAAADRLLESLSN